MRYKKPERWRHLDFRTSSCEWMDEAHLRFQFSAEFQ